MKVRHIMDGHTIVCRKCHRDDAWTDEGRSLLNENYVCICGNTVSPPTETGASM